MKKSDIKGATNSGLITEYVTLHTLREVNEVLGRGTKQAARQCKELEMELVARGLLTVEDVDYLNL